MRPGVVGASEPWTRDPQTHAWTRQTTEPATPMTHGMPVQRTVTASPEQSRQLDAAAQRAMADNVAHSPQGIAQRYLDAHGQHGWSLHGPVPAAVTNATPGELREERNAPRQPMPAQPQPASGPLTPQQIERIATHESRIVPTPGGIRFAEAHQGRDEPERISPGSLQPVGKLDASHLDKGSKLYRAHQAQEQDLLRGLGVAQAQDREWFKSEPAPQRTPQPSVERSQELTRDRTRRHLREEAPVLKDAARPAAAAEAMHSLTAHASAAAPVHSNPHHAAALAAAQAVAAAAQAELAEMRQRIARMAGQRSPHGLERRDERDHRDQRETTQLAQSRDTRQHLNAGEHDKQISASAVAHASPGPLPAVVHAAPGLDDPRHARNPHHALFNQLKERIPDASEKRLLEFTASCHANRITAQGLGTIHFDRQGGNMTFTSSWPPQPPPATVDLKNPSPEPSQSIQHIQQTEQQRTQMMNEFRLGRTTENIQSK